MKNAFLLLLFSTWIFTAKAEEKDSLMQVLSSTRVDTIKVNCWNKLSLNVSEDDSAKTRIYAANALKLSQKINFVKGICESWGNLGWYHEFFRYDFVLAEQYYLRGIELAKKENELRTEALLSMYYSSLLKRQNKHEQVLELNKKIVDIFSSLADTGQMIIACNNLGNAYKNVNQFDKSIASLLKSLELAKLKKNPNQIARAYINIGVCYDGNGDFNMALNNYLSAIEPAKAGGNVQYLASAYGNIGSAYINLNLPAKAIDYLQKALAIYESQNEPADIASVLNNLAAVNNALKKYSESAQNSIHCIGIAREIKDIELEAYGYLYLGVSYQGLSKYSIAEENFLRAKQYMESVNNTAYTMQVYAKLADFYAVKKDYKNAFDFYHKLILIRDTIFNAEKHLQISNLQIQYQTAEKEKALAEACAENLQKSLVIQRKNNLLFVSGLGLIALIIVVMLIKRNAALRRTKLIQEKELSEARAKHQLQDEKLRISRELHDNIGAQLTFINSSLQNLSANSEEEMEQTKTMTLNTIRELRSIVWLINKEEFHIDDLVIKLRDLIKPLQNKKPTIEIVSKGNDTLKLNANLASNVFRIIQEATNNTLKYAEANSLSIIIETVDDHRLRLHIKDDGTGFNPETVAYSFGLKNMETRVKSLKGTFDLKSGKGTGTEINIAVPLA